MKDAETKRIIIGSDHAAYERKEEVKKHLLKKGFVVEDMGTHDSKPVDYPEYAGKVALEVAKGKSIGILICGTGIGMSIAANRISGIRAALCCSVKMAKLSRLHNNANILCMGARTTSLKDSIKIVDAFLKTGFAGEERHERRIEKIEMKYCC